MRDQTVTIGEDVYTLKDESYEDDYGSLRTNYVVYKNNTKITPGYYALDMYSAMEYIPHKIKVCESCGHKSREMIKFDN